MSLPPPPGLNQSSSSSSLPPRPPISTNADLSSYQSAYGAAASQPRPGVSSGYGPAAPRTGYSAVTAFQPRSVTSNQPYRTSSPVVSLPPTGYGASYPQPQPSYQSGPTYYGQAQYHDTSYGASVPHIQNPFAPTGPDSSTAYGARGRHYNRHDSSGLDPETEAQIAQWQSAYVSKEEAAAAAAAAATMPRVPGRRDGPQTSLTPGVNTPSSGVTATSTPVPALPVPVPVQPEASSKTVVRSGGGHTWTDPTLLEWDPAHFRLFVGNLAGEVTDDSLLKAFAKYASVQKARVIRDKRTQKSKGYGFVSFSDGDDFFRAAREMQGKYIGSHPVQLKRATTEIRATDGKGGKKPGRGGGASGGAGGGGGSRGGTPGVGGSTKVKHDGVKKPGKTKGGLKILG